MGFRFQRRIRLLPGVRLNLSKSGVSTSVGGRGAWLTLGRRGPRATVGLPGTGLSYTTRLGATAPEPMGDPQPSGRRAFWLVVALVAVIWLSWRLMH